MKPFSRAGAHLLASIVSLLLVFCLLTACEGGITPVPTDTETGTEAPTVADTETQPLPAGSEETEPGTDTPVTDPETEEPSAPVDPDDPSGPIVPTINDGQTHIAVLSDVHIGKKNLTPMPEDKFASALDQINTLFGNTDALVIAGDLTDRGYDAEYQQFISTLWAHAQDDTTLCTVMGNHGYFRDGVVRFGGESPAFIKECQEAYSHVLGDLDTDTVVNGVHIIGVSARSSAAQYSGCEAFLTEHIRAAAEEDPTMPILVFSHEGLGTLYNAGNGVFAESVKSLMTKYPQVIWFSGHTHFAVNDPRMICQNRYTNIQVPTVGADFWSYSYIDPDQPPEAATASQGLLLSVSEEKVVTIRRYDFTAQTFIGQPWVIDIPAVCASSSAFTYTDRRAEQAADPTFPEGEAQVTEIGRYDAHLTFPAATVEDDVSDGAIMYYHVLVTDKATGVSHFGVDINADYYMGSAKKTVWEVALTGLRHNTDYTVTVTAESVWGKTSTALCVDFRTEFDPDATEEDAEIPCLLEADYTSGSYEDTVSGIETKVYGTPRFENGVCVLDKTTAIGYCLTDTEYSHLKNSVSLETMIFIESDQTYPWGYVNLVSNTEAGGFGTSFYANGDFHFDVNVNGTYKTVVTRIPTGRWVHLVCTYDNAFLRVYIDGELKGSLAATGNIKHVAPISRQLMVGADVNGEGVTQCISNVRVAFVRLWGGGLAPEKVTELQKEAAYPES